MNVVNVVPMHPGPSAPRPRSHASVMVREICELMAPRDGGLYVDATLGAGGHAEAILIRAPGARVVGLDRDEGALVVASRRLSRFGDRVQTLHGRFSELEHHLGVLGIEHVDGLLADLGVSSVQLDDPSRGLSFRAAGPLDMRLDTTTGRTAMDIVRELDDEDLADLIYRYGEERRSRRVARCIKQALAAGELETTLDLRRAVVRAVGPARIGGIDPATRTFQALRIAVNGELDELSALLVSAPRLLVPGGVVAVLSFHSLEDRIVKRALRDRSVWQPLTKKPLTASDEETAENPRARSAKLRAARTLLGEEAQMFDSPDSGAPSEPPASDRGGGELS